MSKIAATMTMTSVPSPSLLRRPRPRSPESAWLSQGLRITLSPTKSQSHRFPLRSPPLSSTTRRSRSSASPATGEDAIPPDDVTELANFKSEHNHIRVVQVSRRLIGHPLAGARLLLLDEPGNIHSISFPFTPLTNAYFDAFAALPPLLPAGPIAILGFGAGTAARILLHFYPNTHLHGWEVDPSVIETGRRYFSLSDLERNHRNNLTITIGDGLKMQPVTGATRDGFAGIIVDLYSNGSALPELQTPETWTAIKKRLKISGGRVMVNCGGRCVEAEDPARDGGAVKEATLAAMAGVLGELLILDLGRDKGEEDSWVGLTGGGVNAGEWRRMLPEPIKDYADMWTPYRQCKV